MTGRLCGAALWAAAVGVVLVSAAQAQEDVWKQHLDRARVALGQRNLPKAEVELQAAVGEAEKFGPEDDRLLGTLANLIKVLAAQAKYEEAIGPCKRLLEIEEKRYGPDHVNVAGVLNDLAGLYKDHEKYDESEPLLKRALAILEKEGRKDFLTSIILQNLAELYDAQKKFADAETHAKRALAIRLATIGPANDRTADTYNILGRAYVGMGKHADAEKAFTQVLAVRRRTAGWNRPVLTQALLDLGNADKAQGKAAEAEGFYKEALRIGQDGLGKNDGVRADVMESYADLLRAAKRDEEAAKLEEKAKAIRGVLQQEQKSGPAAP